MPTAAGFLAAIYLGASRVFKVAHGGAQVLFEGFWMGLLPQDAMDLVSIRSYGDGSGYAQAAYLDSGLQFWETLIVERCFPPTGRILIGSAGGGREIIALARRGYQVTGFECSHGMVAAGQQALAGRGIAATLAWAPPSTVPPLAASAFDAAIIGWNGYTYIVPRTRRLKFLRDFASQLKPGAPLLLSGAFRTASNRRAHLTTRVANFVRVCTLRKPEFDGGTMFPGLPRVEFRRHEIESELSEAGFSTIAFYRWGGFWAAVATNSTPS